MSCEIGNIRAVKMQPRYYEVNGHGEPIAELTSGKEEDKYHWECSEHKYKFDHWEQVKNHLRDGKW